MNLGIDLGYDGTKGKTKTNQFAFPSVTGTPETSSFGYGDSADKIVLTLPHPVYCGGSAWRDDCKTGECIHVQAVKLHLARQAAT